MDTLKGHWGACAVPTMTNIVRVHSPHRACKIVITSCLVFSFLSFYPRPPPSSLLTYHHIRCPNPHSFLRSSEGSRWRRWLSTSRDLRWWWDPRCSSDSLRPPCSEVLERLKKGEKKKKKKKSKQKGKRGNEGVGRGRMERARRGMTHLMTLQVVCKLFHQVISKYLCSNPLFKR